MKQHGKLMDCESDGAKQCVAKNNRAQFSSNGMMIGAAVGLVLGPAFGSIPSGLLLGSAIGLATGWIIHCCRA